MKRISIYLMAVLSISGCHDENEKPGSINGDYFPLHVGDYWEFVPVYTQDPSFALRREITGKVMLDNSEYFQAITKSNSSAGYSDTVYYRVDNNGFVFSRRNNTAREINSYRLNASHGESWVVPYEYSSEPSADGKTQCFVGTFKLKDKEFDNCKTFSFDVEQWADEEHYTVLSKEVGPLREGSAWFTYDLKKAFINGSTFEF
jgi:hypothetical protein